MGLSLWLNPADQGALGAVWVCCVSFHAAEYRVAVDPYVSSDDTLCRMLTVGAVISTLPEIPVQSQKTVVGPVRATRVRMGVLRMR